MESQDYRQLPLPLPQELRTKIYNQMFERPSLSTAINLMTVNSQARQKLQKIYPRLVQRICKTPISPSEIRRYAQTQPSTFGYFVTDLVSSGKNFISTSHVIVLPDNRLLVHTYGMDQDARQVKTGEVILPKTESNEVLWRRLEANPQLLDFATTYEILKLRQSCINRLVEYDYDTIYDIILKSNEKARKVVNGLDRQLQLMRLHLDLVDFLDRAELIQYERYLAVFGGMSDVLGTGNYVPKRFSYNNGLYRLFPRLPANAKPGLKNLGDFFRDLTNQEIGQVSYVLFGEEDENREGDY